MQVENTGQIQLRQEFGKWISRYAKDDRFSRYLEVGTWNGRGSTCCFYDGFMKRTTEYSLQSYETSPIRVQEARALWKDVPNIQILHARVLQNHECPLYERVKELFPTISVAWHTEDVQNFWSCTYVPANSPEVVLLDGGEYLTYFEFEAMKSMDSIRVFLLDDVHTDKCSAIFTYLQNHPDWTLIVKGEDRNGWAVFEKLSVPSEQTFETDIRLEQ